MRAKSILSEISVDDYVRSRFLDKFSVGEILEIKMNIEAYISPDLRIIPMVQNMKIKEKRSLPAHKLYWVILEWVEDNTPEDLTSKYGIFSANIWHEQIKAAYGITSIAFDELDQDGFNDYFAFADKWIFERFDVTVANILSIA